MSRRKEYEKKRNLRRTIDRRKARLEKDPPNITENGKRIRQYMLKHNVKGNYRDYVIVVEDTLIDHMGSYKFVPTEGKGTVSVGGLALIHKRNLKNLIEESVAKRFWHPRLGRAGAFKKPGSKKNCTSA